MQSTSSLPLDLWKQVLTHTSQADRAHCSLVSKAFQAAAVAAMETVGVGCPDQTYINSLQLWLDNHGQYVTDLHVASWSKPATLALLACQHLQQLKLSHMEVLVVPEPNSLNSHGSGHRGGLTALTKLGLYDSTVAGGLVGLSVLTALKELEVKNESKTFFPGSVFQHYRLLTRLELAAGYVLDLHFISCLVSLQELKDKTSYSPSIPNVTRALLPGGLPASLHVLKLRPAVLDPIVLLGLTNLRWLWLDGAKRTSGFELAGGSAMQLLAAIAAMQQLEELHLWDVCCDWPTASSAAYSSLTASSNLTCLQLRNCRLPQGASERMFPPAGVLCDFSMLDRDNGTVILPWQSADVERLVMHCPALRSVRLGLESSDGLDGLTRLSALTSLDARFAGVPNDDGWLEPVDPVGIITDTAAKFTALKELLLSNAGPVDMATLLPLTALRQLTQLDLHDWTNKANEWEIGLWSNDKPPDVWLQLLKVCAERPGCHTIIVRDLVDQHAQLQQQQATGLASALSTAIAAQNEAAAARAEAAAARAQASAAEAAANAARADAAELPEQLAALQAAVQHLVHPQATE